MATEKITIRLSDQDPTEAEIIAILHGKIDGRRAPWLRDVLVDGYRALKASGGALQAAPLYAATVPIVQKKKQEVIKKKTADRTQRSRSQNTKGQ